MKLTERINNLLDMPIGDEYVISLYLKLGVKERENFKYKITLKNLIKKTRENIAESSFSREQLKSIDEDLGRIESFFDDTDILKSCNGIAVFCSSARGVWEYFKLPDTYRNKLVIDNQPLAGELLKISSEHEPVPFLVVDRVKARLFSVNFDSAREVEDYIYPGASRTQRFQSQEGRFKYKVASGGRDRISVGFGEHGFNRSIENEYHQHLKYVSDRLFDYYKENKFDYFLIGGNDQTVKDFVPHLHTYLNERTLGSIVLDIETVREDEIVEHTLSMIEERKRKIQNETIDEFEEKMGSGYSLSGLEPVIKALRNGQVKTLLVEEGYAKPGFICPESRMIKLENNDNSCPEGGSPLPAADIIDHMVEDAFSQHSEVVIVEKETAKNLFSGVGAVLRFKV